MDYLTLVLQISFVVASIHFFIIPLFTSKNPKSSKHPPGPRPFPVIGNILELGAQPHQSLANLSKTYGPVMSLKLGKITTIVISSPEAAKEVLQKNDQAFSNRTIPDTLRALDHHILSVAWMAPSAQWRVLRRACASKVFSLQQLDSSQILRQRKVQELIDYLGESCRKGESLDIEERLRLGASEKESKASEDVLDSLMQLMMEDNSQVSRPHVLHLFLDLFVAGVDTTSSTIEWAMAELLRNPEKLQKVREELQQALHKGEQLEESHISKLPFLKAVVKETMRLHPPLPLLVPHKSEEEVKLCGFMAPKNAQILVNVWAMGRDSSVWNNPNQFMPERFLESEIDFKGCDFELIPFGAGRRICPGLPLAYRTVHFVLASLLLCYDWKLANGLKSEDMDMSDRYGLTLHKAIPLQAIPIKN